MGTATKTYCRAALNSAPPVSERSVRRMIIFPPDSATRNSGGLVRQRHFLLELESGAVYHLSAPYTWGPLPDRIATLAEAIISHDRTCPHQEHIASVVGWALETQLALVNLDLSAPTTAAWPVRTTALQRCYSDSPPGESSQQLAQRVARVEEEIAKAANVALRDFVSGLNPQILGLSSLWGRMPWTRYNWFANSSEKVRAYRIQAARVFPALVPVLSGEFNNLGPVSRDLAEVVDRGQPLIDALASTFQVRTVTARHALTLPPALVEGEKLVTLIRALDRLIPEQFPRQLHEWEVLERLVYDAIPKLTNRPAASPINLLFLPEISRQGWTQAEKQLSRLGVGDGAAALIAEFLETYRKSLTWDSVRIGIASQAVAQELCAKAIDEALATVGLLRVFEASRSFPVLLRETKRQARHDAQIELNNRRAMLRGKHWTNVLEEPMVFEECEIEPLLTDSALSRIGSDLSNCLGPDFASECASGKAHIFCIRSTAGVPLGALHLRFHVGRHGGFEVEIRDCKGPHNIKICAQGQRAVTAFCDWLKTAEAQRRISELPRMRLALSTVEFRERFEMESTVIALRRLRQKSIRFDALRKKVWDMSRGK